jgi:mono/diheme cytochrome c family protein
MSIFQRARCHPPGSPSKTGVNALMQGEGRTRSVRGGVTRAARSPHPAANFVRVDPPPPGEGDGARGAFLALLTALTFFATPAFAQTQSPFSTSPFRFTHQDGAAIYRTVCAGCHMDDGRGAVGAGAYPALARNAKLEAGGYPVTLVVNGQKAMPAFGRVLDDNQVAAVVNYIRGNLGNAYTDRVTPDDVKTARQ